MNDAIDAKVNEREGLRLVNRVKEGSKESKYTLRLIKNGQVVCDDTYPSEGYITGFLCGLYYRENCYQCQFARRERVSDVTLGDFWDRFDNVKGLANKKDGLSMIMANTEAGKCCQCVKIRMLTQNGITKISFAGTDNLNNLLEDIQSEINLKRYMR